MSLKVASVENPKTCCIICYEKEKAGTSPYFRD